MHPVDCLLAIVPCKPPTLPACAPAQAGNATQLNAELPDAGGYFASLLRLLGTETIPEIAAADDLFAAGDSAITQAVSQLQSQLPATTSTAKNPRPDIPLEWSALVPLLLVGRGDQQPTCVQVPFHQLEHADSTTVPAWVQHLTRVLTQVLPTATLQIDRAWVHGTANGALSFSVTVVESSSDRHALPGSSVVPASMSNAATDAASSILQSMLVDRFQPAGQLVQQGQDHRTPVLSPNGGVAPSERTEAACSFAGEEHHGQAEHGASEHTAVPRPELTDLGAASVGSANEVSQLETMQHSRLEPGLRAILRATVTALWHGNQTAARVVLQPESLGTIVVHLAARGPETVVQILVSSAETYSAVTQTVETLQSDLQASGLRAESIVVRYVEPPPAERVSQLPTITASIGAVGDQQSERRRHHRQRHQRWLARSTDNGQFEHFM
jgi:flagellar hook-length control protein FliK